jgi:hypothetical protein
LLVGYRGKITEAAEWEASAGPVRLDGQSSGLTWQGTLSVVYELPRLQARVAVSRQPSVAAADSDLGMISLIRVHLRYVLDPVSSLSLDADASRTVALSSTRAANISLAYVRQVSRSWTFTVRPQYRQRSDETGSANARVFAVTLTYSNPDL